MARLKTAAPAAGFVALLAVIGAFTFTAAQDDPPPPTTTTTTTIRDATEEEVATALALGAQP